MCVVLFLHDLYISTAVILKQVQDDGRGAEIVREYDSLIEKREPFTSNKLE